MKKLLIFAVLGISSVLAGCQSTRVDAIQANEVPVERMYWESVRDKNRGDSQIIVKRDAGVIYSACVSNLFFQGVRVAELWPGEKVTLYVPRGEYILGEFLSGGACFPFLKTLVVNVKPNSINIFRIKTTFMGANGGETLIRDNDTSME
ncbi:hypothetical protein [Xenorhabdus bovienii]|uniref:Lipoprotein n=1 Tax=Xenorhabdus bovienii str. kraussei Becker Underwood TaxID=1398204 RepID=A0A077PNH1_XENBV|nr:hypothetical protein [Xenorhabdus bovienii]CDG86499.1 conserved exported hypothetical protein [Xenorhabdus bovienii str. feltiae France]CDG90731.1 conserved exported hypothetical protein [Xenorhabdus bovienii str. feltiae Florida]CDH25985.1 conserved exported hypothetical protein [Xenorhabdus bovienii str. kraussei Becker Underwood]